LTSIIIPKPNKESPKLFKPIVLLNTISKLIKKVIGERLQFYSISNNSTHPSQLGRLKQWSIINAGVALTYFICSGWVKNINTSTLAFDIAQFFPFLNYQLLLRIFDKASFDLKVSRFFENYLVEQKTQYVWNFFSSFLFNIDIGVGQESALSPILSALYIFPILYIFEKHLKTLKIPISFLSFINNRLLITQNKSFSISNSLLFCSYQIVSSLLDRFGLKLEHGKTEVFHFSKSNGLFNPPPLNLYPLDSLILWPKNL